MKLKQRSGMEPLYPIYPETEQPQQAPEYKKTGSRPVLILGLIALLELIVLVVLLVVCLPHIQSWMQRPQSPPRQEPTALLLIPEADDPQAQMQPEQETEPEPEPEEETTEPTIPPEANPYTVKDFQYDSHNYLYCLRQDSYKGVDVSAFQGDIDWQKVRASGIDFAIIRLGYRGYGKEGKLVEDEYVQDNLLEATEAGLPIGAYFFSQALNIKEVDEEIEFMLKILGDYKLDLPIILDWEIPGVEKPRTKNMDARTLTEIQKYFCQVMTEKGYTPMIYFNWHQANNLYYLSELEDYDFWLAFYQDRMTFPYKVEMWQYTDQGRVPGIPNNVDLNVYIPS